MFVKCSRGLSVVVEEESGCADRVPSGESLAESAEQSLKSSQEKRRIEHSLES